MDPRSPEIEDFVRIENATSEDLTSSIVDVIEPREAAADSPIPAAEASGSGSGSESESATAEPPRRKVLPEELSRSVMVLECESLAPGGVCDVHVVGTAHVSLESCKEVAAVIKYLKPQVVFLELCESRLALLSPQNLKKTTIADMIEMWKNDHNLFAILYNWFLSTAASKLEIFPGTEFRIAYEEAIKYGGKVILGDRPVQITLRRTWAMMPLWHKIKMFFSMIFQVIFMPDAEELTRLLKEMDDTDMLTLIIQELSKEYPTLLETIVHERDLYMSSTILTVASEHSSVVAVVGKGHMIGIKKHWKQPVPMRELMRMPSKSSGDSGTKIYKALGVAVVGVAITSGIYFMHKR